jgi:galactonate dehydratase
VAGQPAHITLGGQSWERIRVYNTCAGTRYVRTNKIKPVDAWNLDEEENGPYEDLDGFMNRADELAGNLLSDGITAMKIWPFDPAAIENRSLFITPDPMKAAIRPFELIRKAVGDRMEIMVELHSLWNLSMAKDIAKALEPFSLRWYEDPIRMNSPQALAEFARSTSVWTCASETLGSRFSYKDYMDRDATSVVMVDLCWTGGLTEGRKIAAMADTHHRPFAPHDCIGPVGFVAAIHMSFSQPNTLIQDSVRAFHKGWHRELVTEVPRIEGGYVHPMEGPGLGTELVRTIRPDQPRVGAVVMSLKLFDLTGRTALVTRSSRGLGRAFAEGLAGAGALAILNGVNAERLDRAAAEMRAAGHEVLTSACDVADEAAVVAAFERLDAEGIEVDILVNNAGIQFRKPMLELDTADWRRVIEINLTSAFVVGREAARRMAARGRGKVINIGSLTSQLARATVAPYMVAKGGIKMLPKAMAAGWGEKDIQAIGPGYMVTAMKEALLVNSDFDAWVKGRTPMRRWGLPEEVAGTAICLASDASNYVSGQIIYADGGMISVL